MFDDYLAELVEVEEQLLVGLPEPLPLAHIAVVAREHVLELVEELLEHEEELLLLDALLALLQLEDGDFGEAFDDAMPEVLLLDEEEQHLGELCHEDVTEGDPREVGEEGVEGLLDEGGLELLRAGGVVLEDEEAQLEYLSELRVEVLLELHDLCGGELRFGEVKDLLAQQLEDLHVVLADVLVRLARLAQLWDEVLPGRLPLVLQDLDDDHVDLVQKRILPRVFALLLALREHQVQHERLNALP